MAASGAQRALVSWGRRIGSEFSYSWLSIPSLLLLWALLATQFPSYLLPQVWDVAREGYRWVSSGALFPHLAASLFEEVVGFGGSIVVSAVVGFAAGFWRPLREYVMPLNNLFMAIPPVAWAPLMMILLGLGYPSIIAVIFIAAVNPMILTIMEGVQQVQGHEVRAARVLGARGLKLFGYVYVPASLPFITTALRIGFSQAWRALIAAEMIGATKGIGWMVSVGGEVGNARQVLLGIVLIGGLSFVFERVFFRQIEKRYQAWRVV